MQAEATLARSEAAPAVLNRVLSRLPALAMAASRGGAIGVQLLLQMAVGALSGPAGLGLLQLFTSWTCVLGEIVGRGQPAYSMRVISAYWSGGEQGQCRAQLRHALVMVARTSALLSVPLLALYLLDHQPGVEQGTTDFGGVLLAVLVSAPLFALLRLGAEALKSVERPLLAVVLESLLMPAIMLLLCAFCWTQDFRVSTGFLLTGGVVGYAAAAAVVWLCLRRRLAKGRQGVDSVPAPDAQLIALWATSVFSILFMHLPFLMLPVYASTVETGVFAVAYKLVNVITTLLLLLAAVFGPAFARAAASTDTTRLRDLLWRTQRLSLLLFTPMVAVLLLCSGWLAGLFSLPSGSLEPFMLALLAGQLVNAATGLPGLMLNMSGAAGREFLTLLATLAVAGLVAPFVGGTYGSLGIAWLFSGLLTLKNLASYAVARHYLKQLESEQ